MIFTVRFLKILKKGVDVISNLKIVSVAILCTTIPFTALASDVKDWKVTQKDGGVVRGVKQLGSKKVKSAQVRGSGQFSPNSFWEFCPDDSCGGTIDYWSLSISYFDTSLGAQVSTPSQLERQVVQGTRLGCGIWVGDYDFLPLPTCRLEDAGITTGVAPIDNMTSTQRETAGGQIETIVAMQLNVCVSVNKVSFSAAILDIYTYETEALKATGVSFVRGDTVDVRYGNGTIYRFAVEKYTLGERFLTSPVQVTANVSSPCK